MQSNEEKYASSAERSVDVGLQEEKKHERKRAIVRQRKRARMREMQ